VAVISGALSLMIWPFSHGILQFFGARGEALEVGSTYLRMTLPASVFLGIGMAFAGILRAVGDAKRAMYVTLGGAIVTACLDPIFIFGFHLGIYGAAIVLVLSRFVLLLVGWHGAGHVHNLVGRLRLRGAVLDFAPLMMIAVPAILTNLATPVANIYAMRIFSQFGQETVAAFAIMDRVTPVAFGVLFALSGSVGPIMGQCFGAGLIDRVRRVLTECFAVAIVYVVLVSGVLWLAAPLIVALFGATGETAVLLRFFCTFGGGMWLFLGGIFVANAAYNNLGAPFMSALFNWGRATLGTIPFVTIGAARFGPEGGFVGMIAGAALFGGLAVVGGYVVIARLEHRMGRRGRDVTKAGKPLNA
jgi:Na+-driven multidrug efflux pump